MCRYIFIKISDLFHQILNIILIYSIEYFYKFKLSIVYASNVIHYSSDKNLLRSLDSYAFL